MTARNRHADMLDGFAAGADDFLVKPLSSVEVLARVQAAERALAQASATPGLSAALAEAHASPGGDLLLRSRGEVGRVFFHAGRVAWVHLSSETGSLHDLLSDLPDVRADDVNAVLEECFTAGRHFADVLIEWEIVTAPELEARLRRWLAAKLQRLFARRHDVVMFVPQQRRYTSGMTFALAELLPTPAGDGPAGADADAGAGARDRRADAELPRRGDGARRGPGGRPARQRTRALPGPPRAPSTTGWCTR
ncbi:hypothetical protein [Nannocystis pusilla]|uniref:hypothetical protein n=1 Tax=Nannocystis pusilla TaxID=889268 RepID=UPI003B75F718